jgi:hypothetical protein
VSTEDHTPTERSRLGHKDVILQRARRNKKTFDGQCDKFNSKDDEIDIENDKQDIINGLGMTSRKQSEDLSDSDKKV